MRLIALWILLCAQLVGCGWLLSAAHLLDRAGAALLLAAAAGLLPVWRKWTGAHLFPRWHRRKLRWRFTRLFPAIFLFIVALALLGGALYPPNNYDALTYRLPRLLNWLSAGHWFWIPAINGRLNYSTTAWEWIAMPFFALLRTDRPLFLINVATFLLMPGLLFALFRQLGVRRKVAWTWMWIFPLAYGYATQAGGLENDLTGTIFALAALCFCLRARRTERVQDIWLAGLAAALMTGAKLSNLPLLLPCLLAVWPALGRLRERIPASLGIAAAALLISAAPTILLNQLHSGSWTGDPKNISQIQTKNPAATFLGNSILLAEQTLMPPVFPGARKADALLNQSLPEAWQNTLKKDFPRYYLNRLNELPQEEISGLGLGITLLLAAGIVVTLLTPRGPVSKVPLPPVSSLIILGAWIAALAYMVKMGSEATGRLMLPYYPLALIPLLRLRGQERLLRLRPGRMLAALVALSVLPALILSPSRPLFPAVSISQWLARTHPGAATQRVAEAYATYARRNDALAPVRDQLPADAQTIGFLAGYNDTDYALWRPFGTRRVVWLLKDDEQLVKNPEGIEWLVCKRSTWPEAANGTLEEWAARHDAKIVWSGDILTTLTEGTQTWQLLRLAGPKSGPPETSK